MTTLKSELEANFSTKVRYGNVEGNVVILQITGSPFIWAALLAFLPQILTILGVVVGFITIYLFATSVPTWIYAIGAIAIVMVFVAPKLGFLGGTEA